MSLDSYKRTHTSKCASKRFLRQTQYWISYWLRSAQHHYYCHFTKWRKKNVVICLMCKNVFEHSNCEANLIFFSDFVRASQTAARILAMCYVMVWASMSVSAIAVDRKYSISINCMWVLHFNYHDSHHPNHIIVIKAFFCYHRRCRQQQQQKQQHRSHN